MTRIAASSVLLVCLAVALAAQSKVTFADKANNMVLRDFKSFQIRLSRTGLSFNGSGSPLSGEWKQQGMTITGQRIEGAANRNQANGYNLQSATVSGDVRVNIARPGQAQTSRVESESVTVTAGQQNNKIHAPGALTLTSSNPTTNGSMVVKGSSGSVLTPLRGAKGFLSAELSGPVTFTSTETEVQNGERRTYTVNGRADRATVDNTGATPTVTLIGNVNISGNHPVLFADLSGVQRAVITLDEKFEAQTIDISGEPARTTARGTGKAAARPKGPGR